MDYKDYKDIRDKIYFCFLDEYHNCTLKINWREFIRSKDIGIEDVTTDTQFGAKYQIVDEKKWLLTRLKYGI